MSDLIDNSEASARLNMTEDGAFYLSISTPLHSRVRLEIPHGVIYIDVDGCAVTASTTDNLYVSLLRVESYGDVLKRQSLEGAEGVGE